jgi:hypothetical protein
MVRWFLSRGRGGSRKPRISLPQASVAPSRVEPSAGFSSPRTQLAYAMVILCDMLDSAAETRRTAATSATHVVLRGEQRDLPEASRVSLPSIKRAGNHSRPSCRAIEAMRAAPEVASVSFILEHPIDPCARGVALLLPSGDLANEMFAFADAEPLRGASPPCRWGRRRRQRPDGRRRSA